MVFLAHGVGGRRDLPIPFPLALVGGALAVAVSFLALAALWRRARFETGPETESASGSGSGSGSGSASGSGSGRPLPDVLRRVLDHRWFRLPLRLLGLVLAGYVAVAAVAGPNDTANPAPGAVYVLFWVGIVVVSALFGPVWRLLNPLRTVAGPWPGVVDLPARLGYWPAVAGLFAFAWLELVSPTRGDVRVLALFLGGYALVNLAGAAVFGGRWFDRCDGFEAYSTVIGHLAPLGRGGGADDRRLVLRCPLAGLATLVPAPGLVALVSTMFGATIYDSFSHAPGWVGLIQSSGLPPTVVGTAGLLGTITLVGLSYTAGTLLCGLFARVPDLPRRFAHSIVPIAVGYVLAHYFSLLVFEGLHTASLASDPLGRGDDLFGTRDLRVDFTLLAPALIASVQVAGVVAGHVFGVIAAHDRALGLFGHPAATFGQLPLMLLMIGYTFTGLYLLLSG